MQIFVGIDYLRLTANDHRPYSDWHGLLFSERLAEERAGRKEHQRWILGYYGPVGQHFFTGRKDDGCIVQVSGVLADRLFRPLCLAGGRASRIDMQVSRWVEGGSDDYLHRAFESVETHEKLRGRPAAAQFTDHTSGARMLTIGSRQSELYGRIYDKFQESKQEAWRGYVRWEVETKGHQAADLKAYLLEDMTRVHTILPMVANFFRQRGVPIEWESWGDVGIPPAPKQERTDDTKLAWLATQVGPTIRHLLQQGKAKQVAQALLTSDADDAMIEWLARTLTGVDAAYADRRERKLKGEHAQHGK